MRPGIHLEPMLAASAAGIGEAVPGDRQVLCFDADGRPRPFQDTMQRIGRDHDVERLRTEVAVELRAAGVVTGDSEVARAFAREVLAGGHEGVIVKDLDAPYAAGRRGWLSNLHLGARADRGERAGDPHRGTPPGLG